MTSRFDSGAAAICLAVVLVCSYSPAAFSQDVVVVGSINEVKQWFQDEDWWGEEERGKQLEVPHAMITGFSDRWAAEAKNMHVPDKKEIFYRAVLPLVIHANDLVLKRRVTLKEMRSNLSAGKPLSSEELEGLSRMAVLLRIVDEDRAANLGGSPQDLLNIIDQALYKLDVIPAGLVLGQAAYESGYGTSRFASQGNALFGQWTYGGKGLVPEQQRKELGDHRIAAFDWPFDSVRSYYINLSSHPAYEDFRRLRAQKRAEGVKLTSMDLADGLVAYSERGQKYVDTLKGIIRVNNLAIADDAVFRDEEVRFLVGAETEAEAVKLRAEIERMRGSGELEEIIARMRLD